MARKKFSSKKKTPKESIDKQNPDTPKTEGESNGKASPTEGTTNDPEWYNMFPQLLADASRFTFAEPLGGKLNLVSDGDNVTESATNSTGVQGFSDYAVPGICTLTIKPSVGYSVDKTSPINVAATALYTHVRYVNSGRKNYDVPDLMLYCLSIADLYAYVMWMQKIFSAAFAYSQRNLYIGKDVLESLGVNSQSVINHLADFRFKLNAFISKVAAYAVPASINIFKRKAFMYAGLYIETEDTVKSQLYQFKPAAFYKFALDSSDIGMLNLEIIDYSNPLDYDALFQIGDDLLNNLWMDEDFGLMSGDILKAFESNIIQLSPVPDAPVLVPTKDPYVLSQFMNASIMPASFDDGAGATPSGVTYVIPNAGGKLGTFGCLYQNSQGELINKECVDHLTMWNAISNRSDYLLKHKGLQIFHVYNAMPDVGDVAEASRLTAGFIGPDSTVQASCNYLIYCGTELVTKCEYWGRNTDSDALGSVSTETNTCYVSESAGFGSAGYLLACAAPHFKFGPVLYAAVWADTPVQFTSDLKRLFPITDLANFTRVNDVMLERLHEVALLSLFYVPGVAMMQ